MDTAEPLAELWTVQAQEFGFQPETTSGRTLTAWKPMPHGRQTLELGLASKQFGWEVGLLARTSYVVAGAPDELGWSFKASADSLRPRPFEGGERLRLRSGRDLPRVLSRLAEETERWLLPFLRTTETPQGLAEFLTTDWHPLRLIGPSPFPPFRRAALVVEAVVPVEEAEFLTARLRQAERSARERFEAWKRP